MKLRLGTRRSVLARTQSGWVADLLRAHGHEVELVHVVTEGDVSTESLASLGGTGVFASALRQALRRGDVDLAVHSFKDLPTAPEAGLVIGAVPRREDSRDVLVTASGQGLHSLGAGAKVGTGSPRRRAQLAALGLGLHLVDIRGNVDTRIGMVRDGRLDAVVLARAGLLRLGRADEVAEVLDPALMLPAPAQGALAVECRADRVDVREALAALDDADSRAAVTAERAVLARLEAGCAAPIGAVARVSDGEAGAPRIEMTAMVAALDGSRVLRRTSSVQLDPVPADVVGDPAAADEWLEDTLFVAAEALGVHVAEQFVAEGADLLPGTVRGVDRGDGAPRPDDPA